MEVSLRFHSNLLYQKFLRFARSACVVTLSLILRSDSVPTLTIPPTPRTFLQKLYTFRILKTKCSRSCEAPSIRFSPRRSRPSRPALQFHFLNARVFFSVWKSGREGRGFF